MLIKIMRTHRLRGVCILVHQSDSVYLGGGEGGGKRVGTVFIVFI